MKETSNCNNNHVTYDCGNCIEKRVKEKEVNN